MSLISSPAIWPGFFVGALGERSLYAVLLNVSLVSLLPLKHEQNQGYDG